MAKEIVLSGGVAAETNNPFAGGGSTQTTAMTVPPQPAVGYSVRLGNTGPTVIFASEADYLKAEQWLRDQLQQNTPVLGGMRSSSGVPANWLNTAGDVISGLSNFFQDRGLRRKMEDIREAMGRSAEARDRLAQMAADNPPQAPYLNQLLVFATAERDVNRAALAALDDQLTAVDLQLGGNVTRVLSDFGFGQGGRRYGQGSDWAPLLAVGGLGLGALLFNRGNNNPPR